MSLRKWVGLLLVSLCLSGVPAWAEPPGPNYSRSGFYVGVNGLYALNLFDDLAGLIAQQDSAGFNVRVGYRARPWLAGELMYEWVHRFDGLLPDLQQPPGIAGTGEIMTHVIAGNLKLVYPDWRIQPYFIAGIGAFGAETTIRGSTPGSLSDWGLVVRPAVGLDFYVTEQIVLNAEIGPSIALFESATEAEIYMSFGGGVQYRF